MTIRDRSLGGHDDLFQIGQLIRRVYARAPRWNAWSFARFDIWAQRRIAAQEVHGRQGWRRDIRLWETAGGELVGAALFESDGDAALLTRPGRPEVAEPMLAWAEARYEEKDAPARPLVVEVMESNAFQAGLLASRDYVKLAGHYIHRHKPLVPAQSEPPQLEPVPLPEGYVVKPLETLQEMRAFHRAVQAVFNFEDSVEVYQILQQAPSYVPDLDLILLSAGGDVAAFCTAWLDGASGVAEMEPVGTAPAYRRRGLAAALLAEASNRLRALGCETATVNSWSESTAANRLYQAAGFQAHARIESWERKPS